MKMTLTWLRGAYICACGAILSLNCVSRVDASQLPDRAQSCPGDNGGITLSPGFCATVFADNLGHPRHMVVSQGGVLYVNTWSGRYYRSDTPPDGGFVVALQDTQGKGAANIIQRFGDGVAEGSAGGTGIRLYNDALYVEQNDRIVRYSFRQTALFRPIGPR